MGSCVAVPIQEITYNSEMNRQEKQNVVKVVDSSSEKKNDPPPNPLLPREEVYQKRDDMAPWTFAQILQQNNLYEEYYGKPYVKDSK